MTTTPFQADPYLPVVADADEVEIRKAVRQICAAFGSSYSRECADAGQPPRELWNALAAGGFVGLNIDEEWGGGGLGMRGLQVLIEEVAASGTGLLMLVVSSAITGSVLGKHGTPEQKDRWLRGIAAGTTQCSFAITEPDAGTNSHNLRTELRRAGDHYLLRGSKTFISGVESADAILVVARMRHQDGTMGKPSLCIIDADAAGLTRHQVPMPHLGPDRQWTLFFDDVEVSADRLVGGEDAGLAAVFDGLNPERVAVAALINGLARQALDKACAYVCEREVWGVPIGSHQAVAHPLAKAKIELELARLMTQKAAALVDAGLPEAGEASNLAKYAAAEAVGHCVDAAIQAHGGNGIGLEYGVSDLWWLARMSRIAPVSSEMILNYVSQNVLGLPRSYGTGAPRG